MEIIRKISKILGWPFAALVVLYQKTLSPDHGLPSVLYPHGYCKFYPSCSEYARLVLLRDGVLGLPKIATRVARCRPGVAPAIDKP